MAPNIHPSAVVDPKAVLGEGVEIGPFAVVGPEVEIGAGTSVGPHSIVEHATLGRDNRIVGHAAVGTPPQDFRYQGEKTRLVMGDRNIVREGATLNRGTTATGLTVIGSDCMFMALSHVAHPASQRSFVDHRSREKALLASGDQVDHQHRQERGGDHIEVVKIEEFLQGVQARACWVDGRFARQRPDRPFQGLDLTRGEPQELPSELVACQLPVPHKLFHVTFADAKITRHLSGGP